MKLDAGVSIESRFSSQGGKNGLMRTNGRNDQEFVLKYVAARVDLAGYGPSPLCPFPSCMGSPYFNCLGKVPVSIQRYAQKIKVFHGLQEPCFKIRFS